jgi:hypothetical protein
MSLVQPRVPDVNHAMREASGIVEELGLLQR